MSALNNEQRLARMREVWQQAAPSALEVVTARQRIGLRRRSSFAATWLWDLGWGAGLTGAALAVYAAHNAGVTAWPAGAEVAQVPQPVAVTSTQALAAGAASAGPGLAGVAPAVQAPGQAAEQSAHSLSAHSLSAHIVRAGEVFLAEPGVQYEVAAGERVDVVVNGVTTSVVGPKLVEFSFEADRAAGFRVHLSERGQSANAGSRVKLTPRAHKSPDVALNELTSQQGAWAQVASAMRRGDQAAAEAELLDLSATSQVATADAAQLALAQLRLAAGRVQEARPVLQRLRASAVSALVRRRATELLAEHDAAQP